MLRHFNAQRWAGPYIIALKNYFEGGFQWFEDLSCRQKEYASHTKARTVVKLIQLFFNPAVGGLVPFKGGVQEESFSYLVALSACFAEGGISFDAERETMIHTYRKTNFLLQDGTVGVLVQCAGRFLLSGNCKNVFRKKIQLIFMFFFSII